jgi:coatomer subunit beta
MHEAFLVRLYEPSGLINANISLGEDALANLSIEKEGEDGPVTGFVRIRSRSQGLALSLGSLKGLNKVGEVATA